MTMNVFGGLELAVGNAINAEEDARAKAAFDEYQEALDAAKAGSPRITNLFVGTENSGRVNYRLPEAGQWYNVFMQLAEQKLKGTIGELSVQELQPSVRGTIAGGALRALDLAFKPDYKTDVRGVIHHDDLKRKVRLGREAVAAMYVFGMTEDKAFLGALETGLQSLTASMGKSNQSKDEFSQSYLALCLGTITWRVIR